MNNKWLKDIGSSLFAVLLIISLNACGTSSSGGGGDSNNGSSGDGGVEILSTPVYVAVGTAGTVVVSANKDDWSIEQSKADQTIWDVAAGSWVAAGFDSRGGVLTSLDDVGNILNEHIVQNAVFNAVATNGTGTWVAVGINASGPFTSISTDDGTNWSETQVASFMNEIAYGNGNWVAVGNGGAILHSTDGINWTSASAGAGNLHGVAFGNNSWVVVGESSEVFHAASADLNNWTAATQVLNSEINLIDVAFDGTSRWVTVGNDGVIIYSDNNGATWTESGGSGSVTQENLMGVIHDGTDWVAVGTAAPGAANATIIHTDSGDIDTWVSAANAPAGDQNLHSIAFKAPEPI